MVNNSKYSVQAIGIQEVNRADFAKLIETYFSLEEIYSLVFNLPFDKENIPGETKKARAEALVEMCAKHGKLQILWDLCNKDRPNVDWLSALESESIALEIEQTKAENSELHTEITRTRAESEKLKQENKTLAQKSNHTTKIYGILLVVIAIVIILVFGSVFLNNRNKEEGNREIVITPIPTKEFNEEIVSDDLHTKDSGNESLEDGTVDFSSPVKSDGIAIYSFENCLDEAGDWELTIGEKMDCVSTQSYDGQNSLAIYYNSASKKEAVLARLEYKESLTEDQLIIMRVFIPQETSISIGGGLFLAHENNWVNGYGIHPIPSGEWVTLAWSTQKAIPWESNSILGVLFSEYADESISSVYEGVIYIDQVELFKLPNRYQNPLSANISDESFVYSFETISELASWYLQSEKEDANLTQVIQPVFDGRFALSMPVKLQTGSENNEEKIARIFHNNVNLDKKWIVARIYTPTDAPSNISAQFFLATDEDEPIWGQYANLAPGSWTSIVWNTADSPPWEDVNQLGIMIKLQSIPSQSAEDNYDGTLHLDLVEILPERDVSPSLDQALKTFRQYNFESSPDIPDRIKPIADGYGNSHMSEIEISETNSSFYGIRSLTFDAELPSFEPDRNYAGISIEFEELTPVDAIGAYIKIPTQDGLESAKNFYVTFKADSDDKGYFSHKIQVPVGEWVPIFWGTGYANGRCTEEDEDGDCAEGADFLWDEWDSPEIENLEIRVWREDEPYEGSVFLDHITFYQLER